MSASQINDTFPVRRDSIEELVGHRNRALELAGQAFALLQEANAAARRACPNDEYADLGDVDLRCLRWANDDGRNYPAEQTAIARRSVDIHAWRALLKLSGLRNLMDTEAHKRFEAELDKAPPAFTVDNILSTYSAAAADAPAMFERSVITVFESLPTRKFKTNSAFKVGPKVILAWAMSSWGSGWNHHGRTQNMVGDMDRVMHILDGKKPPEAGNAADVIGYAHRAERGCTFETEYFEGRTFRNGNLHMKFRRPDLVEKVNRIIAKHYGVTLADDRKAAA